MRSAPRRPSGRYQAAMPLRAVRMNAAARAGSVGAKAPSLDAVARSASRKRRLVGVAAVGDRRRGGSGREVAPLVDEDAGPLDVVGDDLRRGPDERGEPVDRGRHDCAASAAAPRPRARSNASPSVDDRPEDVLLRGDVGVQAGALDVERAGDVANAGRRVAVRVEQRAGGVLDLAPPRAQPRSSRSYLTIVRDDRIGRHRCQPRATARARMQADIHSQTRGCRSAIPLWSDRSVKSRPLWTPAALL